MATLVLTDVQKVGLKVNPVSKAGNPAPVDGLPKWSTSDESVLTLSVSEDGLSCEAVTTGKLGTAQVSVVADADLGDGVTEITAVLDVEVKASAAVNLGLDVGVPTDR
jgi:hypothetical protein